MNNLLGRAIRIIESDDDRRTSVARRRRETRYNMPMQDTLAHESASARAVPRAILRRWEWLAIAAIALLAFAVRVWTIRGGLPYVDHPDEPNPIDYVVRMLRTGDPNPHAFQKPSLYIYLLLAVLSAHYR